jgi:hypothetical protein
MNIQASFSNKRPILTALGEFIMNRFWIALALSALSITTACETIPYEERVKAFEDSVTIRFVGKSVDELILAFGPPNSSYKLSDGRDVLQYEIDRTYTTGGGSYTSYQTATRTRQVRDKDGNVREVEERETIPVQNVEPIRTINQACVRRFVVTPDKRVEAFRWEGNACF